MIQVRNLRRNLNKEQFKNTKTFLRLTNGRVANQIMSHSFKLLYMPPKLCKNNARNIPK